MGNELVVSDGAGEIAIHSGGPVALVDDAGDVSVDRGSAPAEVAPEPEHLQAVAREIVQDLSIYAGFSAEHVQKLWSVLQLYRAQLHQAARAGDDRTLAAIGESIRAELLAGGMTPDRIAWGQEVFARHADAGRLLWQGKGATTISGALIDEMRAIDSMMADPHSPYHYAGMDPLRQQKAAQLQARWRELYDQGVRANSSRG